MVEEKGAIAPSCGPMTDRAGMTDHPWIGRPVFQRIELVQAIHFSRGLTKDRRYFPVPQPDHVVKFCQPPIPLLRGL